MPTVYLSIALVAYVVGIFLASLGTFTRIEMARTAASIVFFVAWLAHLGAVVQRGRVTGRFPLSDVGEYLLFLGLAVMTLHLLLWMRWRVQVVGIVLPPAAAAAGFGALALLSSGATPLENRPRGWFLFHTTVSTLGLATLVVALAMSLIYLFQDRALKSRRTLRLLERLPSLDRCDHIGFQSLATGFVLLSLGIVAGFVVNELVHGQFWLLGVKQYLALLAWIVFAGVLSARVKLGFRGRKSAYLTITGVMLGLLTVAGMTL